MKDNTMTTSITHLTIDNTTGKITAYDEDDNYLGIVTSLQYSVTDTKEVYRTDLNIDYYREPLDVKLEDEEPSEAIEDKPFNTCDMVRCLIDSHPLTGVGSSKKVVHAGPIPYMCESVSKHHTYGWMIMINGDWHDPKHFKYHKRLEAVEHKTTPTCPFSVGDIVECVTTNMPLKRDDCKVYESWSTDTTGSPCNKNSTYVVVDITKPYNNNYLLQIGGDWHSAVHFKLVKKNSTPS